MRCKIHIGINSRNRIIQIHHTLSLKIFIALRGMSSAINRRMISYFIIYFATRSTPMVTFSPLISQAFAPGSD